jgi:hypothetical protein
MQKEFAINQIVWYSMHMKDLFELIIIPFLISSAVLIGIAFFTHFAING